jgi:hypothetical protein
VNTAHFAALALALICGEIRAASICSREESANAEAAASKARDWEAMYDAFHRFSPCDDGGVGEGFSDSVAYLLASRWEDLHDLEHFAEANRSFRGFVLKHIDATASDKDLRRILAHTSECPGHVRPICREIEARARAALRELGKD